MQGILFAVIVAMLFSQVVDYILTVKGMDKGDVETGLLGKYLFPKIGIVWTTFAEVVASLIATAALATANVEYGISFAAAVTVVQLIAIARNVKLLKKQKVL